jgi:hypothetical protein
MARCPVCEKFKVRDPTIFKIGDKVSFTRQRFVGRTIRLTSVKGVITSLVDDETVCIKSRGKFYNKNREAITLQTQPNSLTFAMVGVCECEVELTGKDVPCQH